MLNVAKIQRVAVQIEPLLLRRLEAAQVLALSPRTFDDLVLADLIGKVHIGGLVLYDVDELRAFVRRVRQQQLTKSKIVSLIEENRRTRRGHTSRS